MENYRTNIMNQKQITDAFIVVFFLAIIIILFSPVLPWDKYNLYDYLKAQRLESYNEKHKEHFISCIYCNGIGEREEDINLIMRDAKMALWLNYHLMSEKCKDCDNKHNNYCIKVDGQYTVFMEQYKKDGPKIEMTSCGECMGMGQFSSFDLKEQRYLTQEVYEKRERNKQLTKEKKYDNH